MVVFIAAHPEEQEDNRLLNELAAQYHYTDTDCIAEEGRFYIYILGRDDPYDETH